MSENTRAILNQRLRIVGKPEAPQTEYQEFEIWWEEYAKTLNMRATLVWQEIAWAGWFARSEVSEGKIPSVFPRKEGE